MMLKVENEDISLQTLPDDIGSKSCSYLNCRLQLLRRP